MADLKYDIYFRGEILPEADEAQVKAAIAKIFKADTTKLAQLFSGKVNTIKKSVDKAVAAKYQQAFKKAGAKAVITLAKEPMSEPINEAAKNIAKETTSVARWDILPSGSDLLKPDERQQVPEVNIDTSAIKMVSPFAEVDVAEKSIPPAPDTSHISVAEAGADMNPDRSEPTPDLQLDLSDYTVAEPGAELSDKKEKKIPPAPDTNHIKLV